MADIVYCYNHEVYFNLTNKCPCNCTFCIRNNGDSVGSAKTLWFEKEPTMEEIYKAIDAFDFSGYKEAVFCGYGEPFTAAVSFFYFTQFLKIFLEADSVISVRALLYSFRDCFGKEFYCQLYTSHHRHSLH